MADELKLSKALSRRLVAVGALDNSWFQIIDLLPGEVDAKLEAGKVVVVREDGKTTRIIAPQTPPREPPQKGA